MVWGERRKAAAAEAAAPVAGNGFDSDGCRYSDRADRGDRAETARRLVAIAATCFTPSLGISRAAAGTAERIFEHLRQFPDGIGADTSPRAG